MKEKFGAKRLTKQREIILEELKKLKTHPTAEELYLIIKKRVSNISIGTVYRNLDTLSNKGYILKLEKVGRHKRFDADTTPHLHIYCKKCGKVRDIHKKFKIEGYKKLTDSFKIEGYDFNLYGVCKECLDKN